MAEILGLGLTHFPLLLGTDSYMAALLTGTLKDPDIPADVKINAFVKPAGHTLDHAADLLQGRDGSIEVVFVSHLPASAALWGPAFAELWSA